MEIRSLSLIHNHLRQPTGMIGQSRLVYLKIKKHVTLNDIQKKCDLNSAIWKKQYELANKIVRASPQGTRLLD